MDTRELLFEKFEILDCFKKDTNAAVYLAHHTFLGKKIILKVLNTETLLDEQIVERFKREAKILAKLEHPNIIKVLDFGMYQHFFYISFEYFESENLRVFLGKKETSVDEKKRLLVQLFHGLNNAHRHHIIHRDIKPENIFVNNNLQLKIGDFGLALSREDTMMTSQYSIVGTPSYMSPEQIQGETLTAQSDLFSAGIVAYELFTGENPFVGNDVNSTINNIIRFDEERLLNELHSLPEEIQPLLQRLLRKNARERYENAEHALLSLGETPESEKIVVAIQGKTMGRRKKIMFILSGTLLFPIVFLLWNKNQIGIETKQPSPVSETRTPDTQKNTNGVPLASLKENERREEPFIPPSQPTLKKEPRVEIIDVAKPNNTELHWGELFVECLPWANIYVDSQLIETTPLSKNIVLPVGEHKIMLTHPDFPPYSENIRIVQSKVASVKIHLDTLFGFLECSVFPWSEVYIDGKFFGHTPLNRPLKLFPGEHTLSFRNPKFPPVQQKIVVLQNDTLKIRHKFER